mmetsp:Transcript_12949/g.19337  ORF Transcript_12949/g.19337 Transcript_12949/m.19337 type:complete len:124 (+) Transcript_12949:1644-2015(+)
MTWMDVTGTPSSNQNNVVAPAYQCSGGTPPLPPPTATPPPSPPPTATNEECSSCDGLSNGSCRACGCNWFRGSCSANRRELYSNVQDQEEYQWKMQAASGARDLSMSFSLLMLAPVFVWYKWN